MCGIFIDQPLIPIYCCTKSQCLKGNRLNPRSSNPVEEKLNTWSHAVGIPFGIIGAVFMLRALSIEGFWPLFSILLYSCCFVMLFAASTAYHAVNSPGSKLKLRILDHISIFFLIAGTYSPVALILMAKGNGWFIFYTVWGCALVGTVLKLFFTGRFEKFSLMIYLLMGWLIVFYFPELADQLSFRGIVLLFTGGICYSLGIVFYVMRHVPFHHFVWHIFVLAGALSHWFMIYLDVI